MPPQGFEEEQAPYEVDNPKRLAGQVRRSGPDGPAYEIIESDERVTSALVNVLKDPMAKTIS